MDLRGAAAIVAGGASGLGAATAIDLTVRWTNGSVEKIPNVAADQLVVVREGAGIIRKQKF